ncbi:carbohydrate ABC transporter membrane protein 2, CUT1 family [Quadrisphaera granulorum]|uniref:Carbohydrate ABC transporter membrane protein 2 (CUT1 family) n=1 Tax=Quadrisphaera granulorum TaxID=317664 RepID=A0A315ZTZ1_9ACTN|nr:carbohydrate ABC transporter permease [Quadrisphaera granulorum]PWJ49021.1 carbohydrate ABC transporter membrane protein 2 (CUT1 family) [Quadrisphaera granulorum]SZE98231.1 carbohydrate ABC transporter membrane protein 2, CUT1 family [Quadrisphaera granulorum]
MRAARPLRRHWRSLVPHLVLWVGVVVALFPFYWSVVMATNTTRDIFSTPPKLVPGTHLLENLQNVFARIDFWGALGNTALVAVVTTGAVLTLDSLAAFAFSKFEFPGRRALFGLLLLLFMLPAQLSLIPQFIIMRELGFVGQLQALVLPAAANAFGVFWMRQYMSTSVPDEVLDAARMDGCGFFRQWWHVALPTTRPGLAFLAIFTFVAAWNDYVWPLIVLVNPNVQTLQTSLAQLNVSFGTDYSMVMAGALLAVIPIMVAFLFLSRWFVADGVAGALK